MFETIVVLINGAIQPFKMNCFNRCTNSTKTTYCNVYCLNLKTLNLTYFLGWMINNCACVYLQPLTASINIKWCLLQKHCLVKKRYIYIYQFSWWKYFSRTSNIRHNAICKTINFNFMHWTSSLNGIFLIICRNKRKKIFTSKF